jgi:hypothetical protein
MALTLNDIAAMPSDPDALNQHLMLRGLIPLPPQPAPGLPPAKIGALSPVAPPASPVAPMVPPAHVTPMSPRGADLAVSATNAPVMPKSLTVAPMTAPELSGPAGPSGVVAPMTPPKAPTAAESIAAGMSEHGTTAKEEGQRQFKELRPLVTAPPNSSEFWQQKIAQEEFDKAHPLGSDISANPGAGGKILHTLGNIGQIATGIVAPGLLAGIPGTRMNRAIREAGEEKAEGAAETREGEQALRGAQTQESQARTAADKARLSKEQTEQSLEKDAQGNVVGWRDPQGQLHSLTEEGTPQAIKDIAAASTPKTPAEERPLTDQELGQLNAGLQQRWQAANPGQKMPPEFTLPPKATGKDYDRIDKLLAGTEAAANTKAQRDAAKAARDQVQADKDRADKEKQEKEGETWVTGEDASGKSVMVPQSQAKTMNLQNVAKADNDTVNKTLSARHVLPLLSNTDPKDPGIVQMVDKLDKEGKLGPLASRWNEFWGGKFGASDPDYLALRTRLGLAQTKMMQAHVGSRGGAFMLEHFEDLANAKKMSADNLRSELGQELNYMTEVAQNPAKAAAGGAAAPGSFAHFQQQRNQQKTNP